MKSELARLTRENEELKAQLASDPYTKIEELGAGGFCTVWRAARRVDDQHFIEVCLKELKPKLRDDPDSLRYFRREARIASNLRHGKIVLLIDVDFARYRLVYELVDGVDLRRLLAHAGGRLEPDLVALVGLEISAALEYAHARTRADAPAGVIHRDLKPANVLVSVDGQVMLADFGTAAIETNEPQTSVRGTAAYMSPEQARGRPVDAGTDLFSLGVMLYELVAGRRPFDGDGDGPASFERLARGVYPSLDALAPETPAELTAIITRLLRANREDRYKSASEVFSALSAIAPSHDVVRSLAAMSRAARKRKTKNYRTLELLQGAQPTAAARASAVSDSRAQEMAAMRALLGPERAKPGTVDVSKRRVSRRTIAASLGAMLVATVFSLWSMSQSRSSSALDNPHSNVASPSKESSVAAATHATEASDQASPVLAEDLAGPQLIAADAGNIAEHVDRVAQPADVAAAEPKPKDATLKVSADKSARVHIDGHFAGWSPLRASVSPGSHTILIGDGARQQTVKTQVSAGSTREIFVNLRRAKN